MLEKLVDLAKLGIERGYSEVTFEFLYRVLNIYERQNEKLNIKYAVVMTSVGERKINVIKMIRELVPISLKEDKDMIESVLPKKIMVFDEREKAEAALQKLNEAGATVIISEIVI